MTAHVKALLPAVILPVFYVDFHVRLSWKTRQCVLGGNLGPGANDRIIPFIPEKRGAYTGSTVQIRVRDVLGFTCSSIPVEKKNSLTIFAEHHIPPRLPPRSGTGGATSAVREPVTRSDELLDARKYYPGDDIRRVNWNMLAHLGELYLRVGEEIPPPSSRVLVAVDTSVPEVLRNDVADILLDRAVSFASGAADFFLDRGREVWLSYGGAGAAFRVSGGKKDIISVFFAKAWWSDGAVPLPEDGPLTACLFSFPNSPGREAFIRSVSGHTTVLLPRPKAASAVEREGKTLLRSVLFTAGSRPSGQAGVRLSAGYEEMLKRESEELNQRGRGVSSAVY